MIRAIGILNNKKSSIIMDAKDLEQAMDDALLIPKNIIELVYTKKNQNKEFYTYTFKLEDNNILLYKMDRFYRESDNDFVSYRKEAIFKREANPVLDTRVYWIPNLIIKRAEAYFNSLNKVGAKILKGVNNN